MNNCAIRFKTLNIDILKIRERITDLVKEFFKSKEYLEVSTPLLVPQVIPESYLEVFKIPQRGRKGQDLFLTASPESSLKKMLCLGVGNCFEITKSFRRYDGEGDSHLEEFTMLEWYKVNATYKDLMEETADLILFIAKGLNNKSSVKFKGKKINLEKPWRKIKVTEIFEKFTGIKFDDIACIRNGKASFNQKKLSKYAKEKKYNVEPSNSWESIFNQVFLNEVEPVISRYPYPFILYDYPKPMAALAKIKMEDPRISERFEFYIGGIELGDCYSELTDAKEQETRFNEEMKVRKSKKMTDIKADGQFLKYLKQGMPESSGLALGLDRLVMLFTNQTDIRKVVFNPFS